MHTQPQNCHENNWIKNHEEIAKIFYKETKISKALKNAWNIWEYDTGQDKEILEKAINV